MTAERSRQSIGVMARVHWLWLGLAAGVVVVVVALWATARPAGERRDLGARIAAAAEASGNGAEMDLSDVADFEWDRVYVFDAYSTQADVERELGWNPLSPIGRLVKGDLFLASDGLQLVVFKRQTEVLAWTVLNAPPQAAPYVRFEFQRQTYALEHQFEVIERPDAVFAVREIETGLWALGR